LKLPRPFVWAPLRWTVVGIVVGAAFVALGYADAGLVNRRFEHAQRATGVVDAEYDEKSLAIPITYDNPFTDQRVHTTFTVLHYDEIPRAGSTVEIDVGRDNPRAIRFAGTSYAPDEGRIEVGAVIALLLSGPLLARWFGLWRVRTLVNRPDKTFIMIGALTARVRGRRPLLHLYPLDSDASAAATCVVPLAASYGLPIGGEFFPVEVKGTPRPFGRVVARLESGEILWPAARALATRGRHPRPVGKQAALVAPIARPTGVRLASVWRQMSFELISFAIAAAVASLITAVTLRNAADAETVAARSVSVDAEVIEGRGSHVTVRYDWEGTSRVSSAPAQSGSGYQEGLRYPVLVDPQQPSSIRTAMEPYNAVGPIVVAWLVAAIAFMLLCHRVSQRLFARRRMRTGLWYSLLAVNADPTPRCAVVQLHAPRDWPGSRRAVVLLPRSKPWTGVSSMREVVVCGTLHPFESPVVVADGRAYVPSTRVYFGLPWPRTRNWRDLRARRAESRRTTQPGWSES
jgi:hypothetical protein